MNVLHDKRLTAIGVGNQREAKVLRAIAHPVRLQILEGLARGPACVCDLITLTGRRQPYISQHLMVLRDAGLVACTREGLNIRYHLAHPQVKHLLESVRPILQR